MIEKFNTKHHFSEAELLYRAVNCPIFAAMVIAFFILLQHLCPAIISCRIWLTTFLAVSYFYSLFGARYLDILLPSLISGHKTLVRDLTIEYM